MNWEIPFIWPGRTVAVLASGPSMSRAVADQVRHVPRVAVNNTYLLAPSAEIIHAADAGWWNANPAALACPGIKTTIEPIRGIRPNVPESVRILANTGRDGFDRITGGIRTHANSGAQAVQIAAHAGAARILLLGFDMRGGHWHEAHPDESGNPTPERLERWIHRFRALAWTLDEMGVDVVNCTPGSALDSVPFVPLSVALSQRDREAA